MKKNAPGDSPALNGRAVRFTDGYKVILGYPSRDGWYIIKHGAKDYFFGWYFSNVLNIYDISQGLIHLPNLKDVRYIGPLYGDGLRNDIY